MSIYYLQPGSTNVETSMWSAIEHNNELGLGTGSRTERPVARADCDRTVPSCKMLIAYLSAALM